MKLAWTDYSGEAYSGGRTKAMPERTNKIKIWKRKEVKGKAFQVKGKRKPTG